MMRIKFLSLLVFAVSVSGCGKDDPGAACASREARTALAGMAADHVNRTVFMQPPLTPTEAEELAGFSGHTVEKLEPNLTTCRLTYAIKDGPRGSMRFTVHALADGGQVFGADEIDALVRPLSAAAGLRRAAENAARNKVESKPETTLDDLPPPEDEGPEPIEVPLISDDEPAPRQ